MGGMQEGPDAGSRKSTGSTQDTGAPVETDGNCVGGMLKRGVFTCNV